ncbi:MAG: hypothetical protein JJU00_01300 [Opitutales bacterium]|nr:hypothetical protein [Opitutales bacterium]
MSGTTAAASAADHPRLFFSAEDLDDIRERLDREPYASMFQTLIDFRDRGDFYRFTNESNGGSLLMRARGSAKLYILTGDESYAEDARDDVLAAFAVIGNGWASTSTFGLSLYSYAKELAIIYDFCANSEAWDAALNAEASQRLADIAAVIVNHGGTSQANDAGSNWQANRGASAGIALLATDSPFDESLAVSAHNRVVNYLNRNAGNGESRGWNPEGFGYTAYALGSFVGPYGVAAARADSARDLRATSRMQWKTWTGFAGTTTALDVYGTGGVKTDWSNDNAHVGGEGIYGLAFFYAPEDFRGALRHAYDRFMGALAPHGGNWDSVRHGAFWSILYYPDDIAPQDPLENWDWHRASDDASGLGVFTFRNGYEGPADILAQFKTKRYALGQAHSGADGLGFRVIGAGAPFVIGGGRNNPANRRNQPTVYPSNPNTLTSSNNLTGLVIGTPLVKPDGGGHAIGQMASSSVGTWGHKRWFMADYDKPATGADAVFVVADTSNNGLYWQIPTFLENTVSVDGNTFTITGFNGSTLRGTILHPGDTPNITTGTRPRGDGYILSQGGTLDTEDPVTNPRIFDNRYLFVEGNGDGSFLVVMTLQASGAHPAVEHLGGGVADAEIRVGERTYELSADNILYDGVVYTAPDATVTFEAGAAGTIESGAADQTVAYGEAAAAPEVTAAPGYTFAGWDRAFERVVRDMTVHAVFEPAEILPGSYADWITGRDLSAAEQSPSANPSGDNIQNLVKYAMGLDPAESAAADVVEVLTEDGIVAFRYRVANDAWQATVTPVVSNDASQWTPVAPESIQTVETTSTHTVYEIAPDASSGRAFLRLLVELE